MMKVPTRSLALLRLVAAVTLPALLAACATWGGTAPSSDVPPPDDRAEGVLKGAMEGAGQAALMALAASPLLLLAGPAAIVLAPAVLASMVGGSALIGGVAGAAKGAAGETTLAPPPELQQRAAAAILEATAPTIDIASLPAVGARATAGALASASTAPAAVASDVNGWRARLTQANGEEWVLRVHDVVVRFAAHPAGGNPLVMAVTASAEIADGAGNVRDRRGYLIESPWRRASEWTRDGNALARAEAVRATTQLAERVVDTLVLGTAMTAAAESVAVCGLAPIAPPPAAGDPVAVDTLSPTLEWSAMPDAPSLRPPATATDIRYDLRVWKMVDDRAEDLVVERFGLAQTRHVFDAPLAGSSRFAWTVRMRYVVDGRVRATPWSAADLVRVPQHHGTGVPYYLPHAPDGDVHACDEREMRPCGCLDFPPADSLAQFVTR
jgi:hypothetical protein